MNIRPNFLCIGAQKAGTTWLDTNLRHHPDLWLPPKNELHYFNRSKSPVLFGLCSQQRRKRQRTRHRLRTALRHTLREPRVGYWYFRYLVFPHSDAWYCSLFSPQENQIAGEVTPNYAPMNRAKIAHVHTLLPDAKIIYLLRNPMERVWSQTAMFCSPLGYRSLHDVPRQIIWEFITSERPHRNSNYLNILASWEDFYPPEQIFIGFLDQIRADPRGLLRAIHAFLSVPVDPAHLPASIHTPQNTRAYPPPPLDVATYLAQRYESQIEQLHARFDNAHTAGWLAQLKDQRLMMNITK